MKNCFIRKLEIIALSVFCIAPLQSQMSVIGVMNDNNSIKKSSKYRGVDVSPTYTPTREIRSQIYVNGYYVSLPYGVFSTPYYRSGAMDNYFEYKFLSSVAIDGVYAHLPYYSRYVLESGGASLDGTQSIKYFTSQGSTLYYNYSVHQVMEESMYGALEMTSDYASAGASASYRKSTEMSFAYSMDYTSKRFQEITIAQKFHLGPDNAFYCSAGYGMSIGLVGKYSVVNFAYRNCVHTWFGDKKDNFTNKTLVIANENNMTTTYVFQKDGDSFYIL